MKKIISAIFSILIIILMLCLLIYPDRYVASSIEGLKLWAFAVLPSLLPFFFLTALLTSTGTLTKLSTKAKGLTKLLYNCSGVSAYVQIMSFLSGYPIGAKLIADLKENNIINDSEATRMSTFCSTSGPLFIVGSVGIAMYENKKIGLILLCVHILSSIFCGICFRKVGENRLIGKLNCKLYKNKNIDNVLYDCIYQSVISVLVVGGFVTIFYTLSQILYDFKILFIFEKALTPIIGSSNSKAFVQGLVECTKGCKLLSIANNALSISLACGLISFGGLSVMCQSAVYLKKANVRFSTFFFSKIIQMIFSIVICLVLFKLNII